MTFFDAFPQPRPLRQAARTKPSAWLRPDDVLPASVPFETLLIHTRRVALWVGELRAYPQGFEFTVRVLRPRELDHGEPGPSAGFPFGRPAPVLGTADEEDGERHLRFGVLFADGRSAATNRWSAPSAARSDPPAPPVMKTMGGYGAAGRWEQSIWVWGLPGPGPVTIVYAWPIEGVSEARFDLDGDALREAAGRASVLWSYDED